MPWTDADEMWKTFVSIGLGKYRRGPVWKDPNQEPKHWHNDQSPLLGLVVRKFVRHFDGSPEEAERPAFDLGAEFYLLRAYLWQWIGSSRWDQSIQDLTRLTNLRDRVKLLGSDLEMAEWIDDAVAVGADPISYGEAPITRHSVTPRRDRRP
jgi:hypothetical protein